MIDWLSRVPAGLNLTVDWICERVNQKLGGRLAEDWIMNTTRQTHSVLHTALPRRRPQTHTHKTALRRINNEGVLTHSYKEPFAFTFRAFSRRFYIQSYLQLNSISIVFCLALNQRYRLKGLKRPYLYESIMSTFDRRNNNISLLPSTLQMLG